MKTLLLALLSISSLSSIAQGYLLLPDSTKLLDLKQGDKIIFNSGKKLKPFVPEEQGISGWKDAPKNNRYVNVNYGMMNGFSDSESEFSSSYDRAAGVKRKLDGTKPHCILGTNVTVGNITYSLEQRKYQAEVRIPSSMYIILDEDAKLDMFNRIGLSGNNTQWINETHSQSEYFFMNSCQGKSIGERGEDKFENASMTVADLKAHLGDVSVLREQR